MKHIPFNKIFITGEENKYLNEAIHHKKLSGDGEFTRYCQKWLEAKIKVKKVLLTHSCTAALEMSAILLNIKSGDEIIMPSYTFVSTANAFVLRGGVPVFVDIRADTLNIDENKIESAITNKTKAILPVHYAGVACEMDKIMDIANKYSIKVIEDAAQAVMSTYKNKPLGGIGDLGALSFHETKNIISGEGGALTINSEKYLTQAEIIREKGTNRTQFIEGKIDKYTWQNIGSSFLPGELTAAFLWAQLKNGDFILNERLRLWNRYFYLSERLEKEGLLARPSIPPECNHNGHIFYFILQDKINRDEIIKLMSIKGIILTSHYIPLHSTSPGRRFTKTNGKLINTDKCSRQIIRLPLWIGLTDSEQEQVIAALEASIKQFLKKK
jgi:dTDP-4-amino-4,6-dideoxygalactose transaminase